MRHATDEEKQLANKLYSERQDYKWVASILGRSQTTVALWINPDRKKRHNQHVQNWKDANPTYTKTEEYKQRNAKAALNYYHRSKHSHSKSSG